MPYSQELIRPHQDLGRNVFTPTYLAGIPADAAGAYRLDPFIYPYDKTLTASQANVVDQVTISSDADFLLMGMSVPVATGLFSILISDSRLYYLSNNPLPSTLFSTDPTVPWPFIGDYDTDTEAGGLWIPAGAKISVTTNELTGAPNTFQVLFIGCKRIQIG